MSIVDIKVTADFGGQRKKTSKILKNSRKTSDVRVGGIMFLKIIRDILIVN